MSDDLRRGDRVEKWTGDSFFRGVVLCALLKRDGVTVRYAVENDDGVVMIYNRTQLRRVAGRTQP